MSSDDEHERISISSGRRKKPRAKSTFTYKVGDSGGVMTTNYGSTLKSGQMPITKSTTVKIKSAGSDSDMSATHCHANVIRNTDLNTKARKTLIIASALCLFFMIVEVVGGYVAGSLAIMTDAAHLLSDFASFMISLVSLYLAARPATRRMSFGWHRAEVLGAVVSVLTIWLLTGILVYVAIERIINKNYDINAVPMVITASVGVLVNLLMGIVLHRGGHTHSHGGLPSSHGHSHGGGGGGGAKTNSSSLGHGHGHSHPDSGKGEGNHGHSHGDGDQHGHSHDSGGGGQHDTTKTYQGGLPQAPIDHVYTQSEGTWIEIGDQPLRSAISNSGSSTGLLVDYDDEDEFREGKKKWFKWPWKRDARPRRPQGDRNINIRAALIHVIGDFIQSVGILIAALIIYFRPDLGIMDPICTFVFSILVLVTTISVMRDALNVLMEGLPRGMSFNEVAVALQSLTGVIKVHDLRIWSLTMDKVALSVHLAIDVEHNTQDILRQATHMLRERFRVYECTIQIEHYIIAMDECKSCEVPLR